MVILVRPHTNYLFRLILTTLIAADVNIYASHPKHARPLIGNHENTEIGDFIREYLDVDLKAITEELKEKGSILSQTDDWQGKPPEDFDALSDLDHYTRDFKRSLACACGAVH